MESSGARDAGEEHSPWDRWSTNPHVAFPHVSDESLVRAAQAQLRSTDIVVITFPKTGTTWLQQICHQLRTGGDMSFSEITEVEPWLELAWDCGQDISAEQVANPRVFKSHQLLSAIPPGAKYLSIIRDPLATLSSWFWFQKHKGRPPFNACEDVNEYAKCGHFEGKNIFGTNIWDYYVELLEVRKEPNVLVLCYETILKEPHKFANIIAQFMGVSVDDVLLDKIVPMTTKEFMGRHCAHFDDHFIAEKTAEFGRANKPVEAGTKVTQGHKDVFTPETLAWLDAMWSSKVEEATGLKSYAEMVSVIDADFADEGIIKRQRVTA